MRRSTSASARSSTRRSVAQPHGRCASPRTAARAAGPSEPRARIGAPGRAPPPEHRRERASRRRTGTGAMRLPAVPNTSRRRPMPANIANTVAMKAIIGIRRPAPVCGHTDHRRTQQERRPAEGCTGAQQAAEGRPHALNSTKSATKRSPALPLVACGVGAPREVHHQIHASACGTDGDRERRTPPASQHEQHGRRRTRRTARTRRRHTDQRDARRPAQSRRSTGPSWSTSSVWARNARSEKL